MECGAPRMPEREGMETPVRVYAKVCVDEVLDQRFAVVDLGDLVTSRDLRYPLVCRLDQQGPTLEPIADALRG